MLVYSLLHLPLRMEIVLIRFAYEPLQDHTVLKTEKQQTAGYATKEVTLGETHRAIAEGTPGIVMTRATNEVTESNPTIRGIKEVTKIIPVANSIWHATILPYSSHRDGTIYKERLYWKRNYFVDITDRN